MTATATPLARRLIVTADDLGQSRGVNAGIMQAFDHGIVTSASLMVRWPAAAEGVRMATQRPELSVGLHFDLGEWAVRDGEWVELYRVIEQRDERTLADEVRRQLDRFFDLVGKPPTHLDSHQHVHREEPLRTLMLEAADHLGVPLRGDSETVRYCGSFYGQYGAGHLYPEGITVENLVAIVSALPEGTTELGCHPGLEPLKDLDSMYRDERIAECRALCDERPTRILDDLGIELCSFDAAEHPVQTEPPVC